MGSSQRSPHNLHNRAFPLTADSFGFEPEGGGPFSLGSYCSILKFTLGVNML